MCFDYVYYCVFTEAFHSQLLPNENFSDSLLVKRFFERFSIRLSCVIELFFNQFLSTPILHVFDMRNIVLGMGQVLCPHAFLFSLVHIGTVRHPAVPLPPSSPQPIKSI